MRVRWNNLGINFLRETDVKRKIELTQIKRQIEILSTFMPDEILKMPLSELEEIHTYVGVLLFADVSGFTPLCERYNKTGKGGIYRLTATLNAYIGALVEVIAFYGGDILKFSGDAFLALWKASPEQRLFEVIHQVIVCALFIQSTLGCFDTEVNVLLKVKLAIACGNLTFSVIGNQEYRHYIIVGPAINDVKGAEHVSTSGDVVVAPSAWGHLAEDNYEVTFAEGGNVKVWNCIYFPNQNALRDKYVEKYAVANALCVKHLEHRSQLHQKRRIDDATTDSILTEEFITSLPQRPAVKSASRTWIPNELNPFIVRPVQSQVEEKQPIEYLTEMRQVTIQFINIISTTFQENKLTAMVNKAYQTICKIVSGVRGVVNKVSLFDKDCMFLVLFGLRGIEHELESQNALKSGFAIRKSIKRLTTVRSISVGVTNGWVYCGVVGHPFRREYTVIGGAVNKAARIMCAYEDKVTCDHETYKSSKLSSVYFQLQSALKLKGIADAGHIFEYNEDFDKMADEGHVQMPLIGRTAEMEFIEGLFTPNNEWRGVCFKGDTKIGKTKLLNTALQECSKKTKFVCSLSLNEALQRTYYTVATLYQQMYDILTTEDPDRIAHVSRDLWDWNEILQMKGSLSTMSIDTNVSVNETMQDQLFTLCRGPPGKLVIFFVDNVQFIDNKSLEVLENTLDRNYVRLICAGSFEDSTTWNTMWKLSLSSYIKVLMLEPLPGADIYLIICNFLSVKGVSKKLIVLINKTCEGRPGWVQACLLKMVNNGELEVKYAKPNEMDYVFLESVDENAIVLVAGFSKRYLERSEETSNAITLDLFDSFSAYQQLIIKTAAVLGEIFTRTILIVLLKYPNESVLANAMKTLFEEEIFDCGSRYVHSGGLQEKKNVCLCYMEDSEYLAGYDIPRYAFCKVLHFKSRNIRMLAYELLPLNQKKELHLRITDLLENQNNSCPNCLRDNSASIITIRKFRDILKFCHDQKYIWSETFRDVYQPLEVYKDIIRQHIHNPSSSNNTNHYPGFIEAPRRKVWDPTTCFCLEILMKVYRDLIHHSHCAQHMGKKIFFMLQYGVILYTMHDFDEAIPILQEASELCMMQSNKAYIFTGNFQKVMMGKIHYLLGCIYFKNGNLQAAKNHAILSMRQYNVPLISFKYTIPHKLLNRACLFRFSHVYNTVAKQDNPMLKLDFGMCLGLISHIYAAEGSWDLARIASYRSISYLKRTNPNVGVLCDVYTNALNLYSMCGDMHVCEKLERCFNKNVLRYYSNNIINEVYSVSEVLAVLFLMRTLAGDNSKSVQLGHRSVYLAMTIQAHIQLLETLPLLASTLLIMQRVDEAVYMARLLFNIGKKFNVQGYIAYYSFCLELILETNFYLETIENIETFVMQLIDSKRRYTSFSNKVILYLYNHSLRKSPIQANFWKRLYNTEETGLNKFLTIMNLAKYLECLLLEQVRCLQQRKPILQMELDDIKYYMEKLKDAAMKWDFFKPRYFHLKAYQCRINNKIAASKRFLMKTQEISEKQNNILERSWAMLHLSTWFGKYQYDDIGREPLLWKLAKTYSPLEWCQVLYVWPMY